ncbi:hypothetical protein BH18ACI4_BH18ACI4_21300 [soil metagenome]
MKVTKQKRLAPAIVTEAAVMGRTRNPREKAELESGLASTRLFN